MNINGYDLISEQGFVENWGTHGTSNGDLYFYGEGISLPIEHVWTVKANGPTA